MLPKIAGEIRPQSKPQHSKRISLILELKAVKEINEIHEVQLVNYLKGTGIEVGLLINFGPSVQVKRKVLDSA